MMALDVLSKSTYLLLGVGVIAVIVLNMFSTTIKRGGLAGSIAFRTMLSLGLLILLASVVEGYFARTTSNSAQTEAKLPTPNRANLSDDRLRIVSQIEETFEGLSSSPSLSTRIYDCTYSARVGFRIVEAKFIEKKMIGVDGFSTEIAVGGSWAQVHFQLTSSPAFDRPRAMVNGDLALTQEKLPNSGASTIPPNLPLDGCISRPLVK